MNICIVTSYDVIDTTMEILSCTKVNLVRLANGHPDTNTPNREDRIPECYISPTDTRTIIEQGELLCGMIDKKSVGNQEGNYFDTFLNFVENYDLYTGVVLKCICARNFLLRLPQLLLYMRYRHKTYLCNSAAKQRQNKDLF